ncbi:MAG: AraC family transcriptional regulator [Nocardioidaceae bacterium]|nr:AraC family transcriptional regulator [Nocardioidaceae bacterium]
MAEWRGIYLGRSRRIARCSPVTGRLLVAAFDSGLGEAQPTSIGLVKASSASVSGSVYREYPVRPGVADARIACTWEQRPAADSLQLIVPDGCVDLIWLADRELVIAGPDTGPREVWLPAALWSLGVRFRPGAAGGFLGIPASEVRDQQVFADAILGGSEYQLIEDLADGESSRRRAILVEWALGRTPMPDPLVAAAAARLSTSGSRVSDVARDLGVSERSLHRRVTAAVGYGPKTLARILRLRQLSRPTKAPLADRAIAAGYASQAHMNEEVRRLTGQTPVRFLKDPAPTPN